MHVWPKLTQSPRRKTVTIISLADLESIDNLHGAYMSQSPSNCAACNGCVSCGGPPNHPEIATADAELLAQLDQMLKELEA
jgi:hypothetical protein